METTLANNQETAETAPKETETTSQKDAVYTFALEVLTDKPAEGQALRTLVTKEVRKAIRGRLFQGVKSGQIKLARTMDDSKLKKYCSNLINNWLKKDSRFN